jgi:hypothetical protein
MRTSPRRSFFLGACNFAVCLLGAGLLGGGLSGCGPDRHAGGEILNPPGKNALTGIIYAEDGKPALGAIVTAFPAEYDPGLPGSSGVHGDTTDADGAFSISGLDTGAFNLWALQPRDGTRLLVRNAVPGASGNAAMGVALERPGSLSIPVPDSLAKPEAYVYLKGTPAFRRLDMASVKNRRVLLDSVPAGITPGIFYALSASAPTRPLLAASVLVRSGDTVPVGTYVQWPYSKRAFISASPVPETLLDFPLLLRLNASQFNFSQAKSDGSDLRITRKDGRPLPFEIESWNADSGRAAVWIRMDTLQAPDSAFIRLYWGNPQAASLSDGAKVFDSAGYQGVWHLDPPESGAPLSYLDASAAANTVSAGGDSAGLSTIAAPAGKGIRLTGGTPLTSARNFDNPGPLTVSLWFRTTTDSGGKLIGFGTQQSVIDSIVGGRDRHIWMDSTGRLHFGIDPVGVMHVVSSAKAYNDGAWHFAAATVSPQGIALYVDGEVLDTDATGTMAQVMPGYWRIGFDAPIKDWPFPLRTRYFQGDLDEVRVTLKPLTPARIRFDFESQRLGSGFIRVERDAP